MRQATHPRPAAAPGPSEPGALLGAFLAAVGGAVRQSGAEHIFRCPCSERHANGDATPSGSVRLGDDGRQLVICRTGCSTKDIVAAIGWSVAKLMPGRPVIAKKPART